MKNEKLKIKKNRFFNINSITQIFNIFNSLFYIINLFKKKKKSLFVPLAVQDSVY
jgi:hypothetical protein